ncbi:CzcE family metal-binding protein [Duganella sp.]|uniref:CzcE family metal-binding protein n=1 Tax=Duganella sp. TaxID=1904440 RepID=UPI0031D2C1AE
MFKALRITVIAATLAAGAAHASVNPHPEFGMATPAAAADRHITIKADTKWVNVNNGDTVTFDVNGKSFTWHFDTLHSEAAFDLAKIAPEGINPGMITVYVASNPLYRG